LKPITKSIDSDVLYLFPRLKKRGPIEAIVTYVFNFYVFQFPRLKKRGPIEAIKSFLILILNFSYFRA